MKGMDATARNTWAAHQVYIALGTFLTSAALLGIDACPMEGIEPAQYDEDPRSHQSGVEHCCRRSGRL